MLANPFLDLLNVPGLAFDENGCACAIFGGHTDVNFEKDEASGNLYIYSVLSPLPRRGEEGDLFRTLLQGNLFCRDSGGATLAIDALAAEILLCLRLRLAHLSHEAFIEQLEYFVAAAAHWKEQITTAFHQAQEQPRTLSRAARDGGSTQLTSAFPPDAFSSGYLRG